MSIDSSKFMFFKCEKYIEIVSRWMAETSRRPLSPLLFAIFISVIVFGGKLRQSSYLLVSTFQRRTLSFEAANKRSGLSS